MSSPMGGEIPPMGDDMPPMNDNPDEFGDEMMSNDSQMDSEFDTNFDAGVEADEDTDPKKYIQQLTGKLSQTLNTYNNENGEPDVELGKYVLGMLVKQGVKGMDEKDKKDIIKKINMGGNDESEEDNTEEIPMDDSETSEEMNNEVQMESKTFNFTKKQIFENFGIAMDDKDNNLDNKEPDTKIKSDTKRNRRTKPFEAPTKFKE